MWCSEGLSNQGGTKTGANDGVEIVFPISFRNEYIPFLQRDASIPSATAFTVSRPNYEKLTVHIYPTNDGGKNIHWVAFGT